MSTTTQTTNSRSGKSAASLVVLMGLNRQPLSHSINRFGKGLFLSSSRSSFDEGRFDGHEKVEPRPHPLKLIGRVIDFKFIIFEQEIFWRHLVPHRFYCHDKSRLRISLAKLICVSDLVWKVLIADSSTAAFFTAQIFFEAPYDTAGEKAAVRLMNLPFDDKLHRLVFGLWYFLECIYFGVDTLGRARIDQARGFKPVLFLEVRNRLARGCAEESFTDVDGETEFGAARFGEA